jgi:hypothetical protein
MNAIMMRAGVVRCELPPELVLLLTARRDDDVLLLERIGLELGDDDCPGSGKASGSPDPPLGPVDEDEEMTEGPPQIARDGRR